LGESNEVSPDLVRLERMRSVGRSGQRLVVSDWFARDEGGAGLYERLRQEGLTEVVAIRVGRGSRLDTTEFRGRVAADGGRSERWLTELEARAGERYERVAQRTIEGGAVEVGLWRVLPPR
jgi:hypothetical protein